jgi:hypothetical protein
MGYRLNAERLRTHHIFNIAAAACAAPRITAHQRGDDAHLALVSRSWYARHVAALAVFIAVSALSTALPLRASRVAAACVRACGAAWRLLRGTASRIAITGSRLPHFLP